MSFPTILTDTYPSLPPLDASGRTTAEHALSETAPFEDDDAQRLFITTNGRVCSWQHDGCSTIFRSGSQGIVAARRARDGSAVAIADAHVVMIHRIEEGQDKSYRLRGTQRPRLLQYDHDSRNLFFTDAVHNSVQSYSVKDNRVSGAAKPHPSEISSFAVSCDSNLILSCSDKPPTVQIYNRLLATTVTVVPRSSESSATTCAFHPSRKGIFMLAFRDGVLAAYDYNKLAAGGKAAKGQQIDPSRVYAKAIHAFRHLHDSSVSGSSGIAGVGFVPGHKSRAITVGEDGRMFLLDFEKQDTLGSWHIGAPATAMSIRQVKGSDKGYLVAIGTVHGRCYVYDSNGNKIGGKVVDPTGGSILDLEWVSGDVGFSSLDSDVDVSQSDSPPHRTLLSSANPQGRRKNSLYSQGYNPPVAVASPRSPSAASTSATSIKDSKEKDPPPESPGYMNLFSPIKKKPPNKPKSLPSTQRSPPQTKDPKQRATDTQDKTHRSALSAPQLWNETKENRDTPRQKDDGQRQPFEVIHNEPATGIKREGAPAKEPVLLKSALKNGSITSGNSSLAPPEPAKIPVSREAEVLSEIRSVRAKVSGRNPTRGSGNLSLFAPYMSGKLKGSAVSVPTAKKKQDDDLKRVHSMPERLVVETLPGLENDPDSSYLDGSAISDTFEAKHIHDVANESTREDTTLMPDETLEAVSRIEEAEEVVDIWLAEGSRADSKRNSRKRKMPSQEAQELATVEEGTSTVSSSRSSKSRKTVSWAGNDDHPEDEDISSFIATGFPLPPSATASVPNTFHLPRPTVPERPKNTRMRNVAAPAKPAQTRNTRSTAAASIARVGSDVTAPPTTNPSSMEAMLLTMQAEMRSMQSLIMTRFDQQNEEIKGVRQEMEVMRRDNAREIEVLRQENTNLRTQLFVTTGVRERLRRVSAGNTATASGSGTAEESLSPVEGAGV